MTNEQWSFCAGLSTGAAIFVVGAIVGALVWHAFLVVWSKWEHSSRLRRQDKMYQSFMSNKPKKE